MSIFLICLRYAPTQINWLILVWSLKAVYFSNLSVILKFFFSEPIKVLEKASLEIFIKKIQ